MEDILGIDLPKKAAWVHPQRKQRWQDIVMDLLPGCCWYAESVTEAGAGSTLFSSIWLVNTHCLEDGKHLAVLPPGCKMHIMYG